MSEEFEPLTKEKMKTTLAGKKTNHWMDDDVRSAILGLRQEHWKMVHSGDAGMQEHERLFVLIDKWFGGVVS